MPGKKQRTKNPVPTVKVPSDKPLPVRLRMVFSAAMVLIPVLFFLLAEGVLRLVGYGDALPLFVHFPDQPEYRYQNPNVGKRYFGDNLTLPGSNLDYFKTRKPENGYRIFVLGGSSAAGFPYYRGGSFPRMLERRLQAAFPDREIEVINTGMSAINSYSLLDFTPEILAYEPDAVLIYAGHNEYYGAMGVGSSQTVAPFPGLVRTYLKLRSFRVVQGVRQVVSAIAGSAADPNEIRHRATLMERMVKEQEIPLGSPLFEQGVDQWRGNLDRIVAAFRQRNIPVFIGIPASNERHQRPFSLMLASNDRPEERENTLRRANNLLEQGNALSASDILEKALLADSTDAQMAFLLGTARFEAGEFDNAASAFIQAKEHDPLRFRAPEAIVDAIYEVAEHHGATTVEVREAMRDASEGRIIGSDMMLEHLHPTLKGLSLIANTFFDALERERLIGEWPEGIRSDPVMKRHTCTPVDSLAGRYRIMRLMAGWPFVPAGSQGDPLEGIEAPDRVAELALAVYVDGMDWQKAMVEQIQYFNTLGRPDIAVVPAMALAEEYPFNASGHMLAANMLVTVQRYREALYHFGQANALEPSGEAERMIGSIKLQLNDRDEAIRHLERAVVLQPENTQGLYNLAGAYALDERYDDARSILEKLLALAPDHEPGRRLLASLPG